MSIYRIRDVVVLSELGHIQRLQGKANSPYGQIVDIDRQFRLRLKVRKLGQKTASWYAAEFWRLDP